MNYEKVIGNLYEKDSFIAKQLFNMTDKQGLLIYQNQPTCLGIFQNLFPISQQYLIKLINMDEAIPSSSFKNWAVQKDDPKMQVKLYDQEQEHELVKLNILQIKQVNEQSKGKDDKVILSVDEGIVEINHEFKMNLRKCFDLEFEIPGFQEIGKLDQENALMFEKQCKQGWKKLSNYLVISESSLQREALKRFGETFREQHRKFQFILSSTKHQLTNFLNWYCKYKIVNDEMKQIVINTIINLSYLSPDKIYEYTQEQDQNKRRQIQEIFDDFFQINLINRLEPCPKTGKIRLTNSKILYKFLTQDPGIRVDTNCQITVETNFMVYIEMNQYDKREIQEKQNDLDEIKKLVDIFTEVHYIFPHMIVCELSQNKVKTAYNSKGITASLIIDFFEKCCSEKRRKYINDRKQQQQSFDMMRNDVVAKKPLKFLKLFAKDYGMSLIPENVVQQLELWELEKNKIYDSVDKGFIEENLLQGDNSDNDQI